ncbi:HrgC protein, partial [Fusobacterium pseudoperiodonticum]
MSVRINLEKDGKKESGFMGFSWTLLFWGFWVPLFRGRNKDFGLFFLFFLVKIGLIVLTFKEQFRAQRNMEMFGFYKPSYILLIPTLIFVIIEVIEVWLAYYYNRHCTNTLLANGYYPEENDEYSIALLKEFTYIPYTKEELEDKSIREKYKKFSDFARKEERDKFK